MNDSHLLILQVILPLLASPVCILIRKPLLVWFVAVFTSWTSFIISCRLLQFVSTGSEIQYFLGGWVAPWGIEYHLGVLNAFILIIVSAIGSIVMTFARQSVMQEIAEDRIYLFYTSYLLCLTGLFGVVVTGDVFNLFVFIEISSLSSYALISLGRNRSALLAAYRYLIQGTIGATFILIGIGLLYAITGTLNISDLQYRIQNAESMRTVITALAFLTVGISIKFALFPLHSWLPNAYAHAPTVVSAFLAGTTTKVFIYVLLKFLFIIFGVAFVFDTLLIDRIFMASAILAIFSGSISAIFQTDIRRMLAYSSIAQIGYMVLGISMVSVTGLLGGIVHLFNHALIKASLFLCMSCIFYRIGSTGIESIRGIGKKMPWTMAAFVISGMSLVGVPLTVGFISKWYLIQAALERDWWWMAFIILSGSVLAVIYIWRVVEAAYLQKSENISILDNVKEIPLSMLIPLWVLIIANLYYGINSELTSNLARQSANYLLGAN